MSMGRGDDFPLRGRLSARRVYLSTQGYEHGAPDVYWGHGAPLYRVQGSDGGCAYVRARTSNAAKCIFVEENRRWPGKGILA
jgi:hypothetical protein